MVMPIDARPQIPLGFYATNNRFLTDGPKGFIECKTLENDDTYLRIDLPGVSNDDVTVKFYRTEGEVSIVADAPKRHDDYSNRIYNSTHLEHVLNVYGINITHVCKYCREYTAVKSYNMSDGVLRLILTKNPHIPLDSRPEPLSLTKKESHTTIGFTFYCSGTVLRGTDPNDPALSGMILMPHPGVSHGLKMAYESKKLRNGNARSLYVRVDMPGVPKENFIVSVTNERVKVTGEAPALSHDSGDRLYSGNVAILSPRAANLHVSQIETFAENGVIRLVIPSV